MDYRDELFDVVDEHDNIKTGLQKDELHVNDDITRIVTIYVTDGNGSVYIAQRSPQKEIDPLKFEAPAHGRVNSGEEYDDAAHREALEELGVTLHELIPIDRYYTVFHTNVGIRQHFKKLYIGKTKDDLVVEEREIHSIKDFQSFEELFNFFENNSDLFSNAIAVDMEKLKDFLQKS